MNAYAAQSPIQEAADKFKDLDANGLVSIILSVASWFLLLIGLIAVVMVLWSAFQFVTAGGGNEEQVVKARKTLVYSLIGVVIAILAFSVVTFTNSIISSEDRGPAGPPTGYECIPGDPSTCPAGLTCVEELVGIFPSATCQ